MMKLLIKVYALCAMCIMTTDYSTFVSGYAGNRWKEISLNLQS